MCKPGGDCGQHGEKEEEEVEVGMLEEDVSRAFRGSPGDVFLFAGCTMNENPAGTSAQSFLLHLLSYFCVRATFRVSREG